MRVGRESLRIYLGDRRESLGVAGIQYRSVYSIAAVDGELLGAADILEVTRPDVDLGNVQRHPQIDRVDAAPEPVAEHRALAAGKPAVGQGLWPRVVRVRPGLDFPEGNQLAGRSQGHELEVANSRNGLRGHEDIAFNMCRAGLLTVHESDAKRSGLPPASFSSQRRSARHLTAFPSRVWMRSSVWNPSRAAADPGRTTSRWTPPDPSSTPNTEYSCPPMSRNRAPCQWCTDGSARAAGGAATGAAAITFPGSRGVRAIFRYSGFRTPKRSI